MIINKPTDIKDFEERFDDELLDSIDEELEMPPYSTPNWTVISRQTGQ